MNTDKIKIDFAELSTEEQARFITDLLDSENIRNYSYEQLKNNDGDIITLSCIKNNIGWEIKKRDEWQE